MFKITFVVPFTFLTGGIRVIAELCCQLKRMGHSATMVSPRMRYKDKSVSIRYLKTARYFLLRRFSLDPIGYYKDCKIMMVPEISDSYVPDADVVFATAYRTAYWVNALSDSKGEKYYYIQHYEVWGDARKEDVDATWKMPLKKIVIAPWLKELGEEKFGERIYGLIPDGINRDLFFNRAKVFHDPVVLGMIYRENLEWKGMDDGFRAIDIVREKYPQVRVLILGDGRNPKIPAYAEYRVGKRQRRVREFYSDCDIFIFPSWYEGFGLPPMEAMACKCAVASTDVGAVGHYGIDGRTVLLSQPRDPEALAANICRLIQDRALLRKISFAGHEHISRFTWERAAEQLVGVLKSQRD